MGSKVELEKHRKGREDDKLRPFVKKILSLNNLSSHTAIQSFLSRMMKTFQLLLEMCIIKDTTYLS